jgi:hypothetical protein
MKIPQFVLASVVLFQAASFLAADAAAADWVKVPSADWKCEASFPGKPMESSPEGGLQLVIELDGGSSALMLKGDKIPATIDLKDADTVSKIFDGGRDGLLKVFPGAKLIGEKNGKLNNKAYPSRDIDVEIPKLGIYRVRVIFDGSRLYQVTVLGPKEFVDGDVAKKFMESFKFTD